MATSVKTLRVLSPCHVVLGILAIVTGIASINVTEYYNGVFGMGIWLGAWIFLTGLAGMASAAKPGNYCRVGTFLGCCVVALVILTICSIIIGTVVIKHFQFESTVTREYYKGKGVFGKEHHDDYFESDQYFYDRNKAGKVGVAIYSCLLIIIIADILLNAASVYLCRDLASSNGQATIAGQNNRRTSPSSGRGQVNTGSLPVAELRMAGQNWAELVFQGTPGTLQPIHLIQNSEFQFFTPCKLPNYAELYPDGLSNPAVAPNEQALEANVPDEPPPAYTPTADGTSLPPETSLPVSSSVVSVQESAVLSRNLTPVAIRTTSTESQEHLEMIEPPTQHTGSSTPVLSLQLGDLEAPVSVSSTPLSLNNTTTLGQISPLSPSLIITDLSTRETQISEDSHSSGSLPNLVEMDELEGSPGTISDESQNEATNSERPSEVAETR